MITPEKAAAISPVSVAYDVKRIRLFHQKSHDVIGVTENALPLLRSETFRSMLGELGHSVSEIDDPAIDRDFTVDHAVSIEPPFEPGRSAQLQQLGEWCTNGTFVAEWAPDAMDNLRTQGVLVVDNRDALPNTALETAGEVISSSLDYVIPRPELHIVR